MKRDVELFRIQNHSNVQGNKTKVTKESSPVHRKNMSQINNQHAISGDNDIKHEDVKRPEIEI